MKYRVVEEGEAYKPVGMKLGDITTSFDQLRKLFGEPSEFECPEVCFEWTLVDDEGNGYTIYDYKATTIYGGDDYPTVEEFQRMEHAEWSVQGPSDAEKGKAFLAWVKEQIEANPVEYVELIVDLQSVRVRVPKATHESKDTREILKLTKMAIDDKDYRGESVIENYQTEEELG